MGCPFPQQFHDSTAGLAEFVGFPGHLRVGLHKFEEAPRGPHKIREGEKKITQGMATDPFPQDQDLS